MIALTPINFFLYFSVAWGANISLNLLYVAKKYIPRLSHFDRPIDGGLRYGGDRLVGDSTTVIGIILCLVLALLLFFITTNLVWASIPLLVYIGDLSGGFIKRRLHKREGEFVLFVDHGDYMLCLGIFFASLGYISWPFAILAILITYVLHPLACLAAFKLKLRKYPY